MDVAEEPVASVKILISKALTVMKAHHLSVWMSHLIAMMLRLKLALLQADQVAGDRCLPAFVVTAVIVIRMMVCSVPSVRRTSL